jgi:hypothetical protein
VLSVLSVAADGRCADDFIVNFFEFENFLESLVKHLEKLVNFSVKLVKHSDNINE